LKETKLEAYIDIETTSLSPINGIITVIGIYVYSAENEKFLQLVGEEITSDSLLKALEGVKTLYTYNGSRFDLSFIKSYVGIDLVDYFEHRDLMFDCWKNDFYGGLKTVETMLGIERRTKGVDGKIAVELWVRYKNLGDENALKKLLDYNKEDVMNLKIVKERLCK